MILVHAVFLFDATFTIVKRLWRGENITSPHREHSYQLLVRCGWSHASTTLTVLMLSTGSCLAACCYARFAAPIQWSALVGTTAGLTAYAVIAHTGGRFPGRRRPSMTPLGEQVVAVHPYHFDSTASRSSSGSPRRTVP